MTFQFYTLNFDSKQMKIERYFYGLIINDKMANFDTLQIFVDRY